MAARAASPDAPKILIAQQSVMSLIVEPRLKGQALGTGTAFVVNGKKRALLLTAKHVITGHSPDGNPLLPGGVYPDELAIRHNRNDRIGSWIVTVEPLYQNGKSLWVEPVLKEADFVALALTQLDGVQLYPYELNDPSHILVSPADTVSVIGFPFGISARGLAVWATGFVATDLDIDFNGQPIFLIDCRSRPGQSGSPVIAYRGHGAVSTEGAGMALFNGPVYRFLGIYSGRINSESDLGMVWKAAQISDLVSSI
jgi:S1-C subfamily serine protease